MLTGSLVRLRAPEPADLAAFHRWFNDRRVTATLGARYPMTVAGQREWLAAREASSFAAGAHFAIETLAGDLVGSCGLFGVHPEDRRGEVGLIIGEPAEWGRGYGTDALRLLCRFGFEEMGLHRIELLVFADHAPARRVYERLGFVVEAVARENHWADGRWLDDVHMALLAGELR
jgi:RimJ/RimL family protein N-acetyltransferase